jgi:hypothetical protein
MQEVGEPKTIMKTQLIRLFVALALLALPALVQAQFNVTITNNGNILIQFSGGVPGALYDVEESSNLLTWTVAASDPADAMGGFSFQDTATAGVSTRFYRAVRAFTVGGTLTGLPAGDTILLSEEPPFNNGLTLSTNGTFTFPTPLADGQPYSVSVMWFYGGTPMSCTFTNRSGTISGANVTNIAVQCYASDSCFARTGNRDIDMLNAAVADGTDNGGVPAVMLTQNGGPFKVTAMGPCSYNVARVYPGWAVITHVVGTYSCSSTTLPTNVYVIQFGTLLECGVGPYQY